MAKDLNTKNSTNVELNIQLYKMIDNEEKILNIFFDYPTKKFHIRELSRISKLNPNTVINILENLRKEGLIERKKKKHLVEVSAIVEEKFKTSKRLSNLKRLYGSEIINFLKNEFLPEAIVVIGSYSTGEDIENSDVDLIVISKKDYIKNMGLNKFEKSLNRKIHLIVTGYSSISEEFYLNLINGIVLYGYLDKK